MWTSLIAASQGLIAQVDAYEGTAAASHNARQRLQDPTYYDAVFPFIAFCLVIVLPSLVACWVIFRTLTDKTKEADET